MTEKFRLSGIGLDTSAIDYNPGVLYGDDEYNYVYTSISSSNDYNLPTFLSSFKNSPILIVHSDYLDSLDLSLKGHLKAVGRTNAKLLLISDTADWSLLDSLEKIKTQGTAENFGIQVVSQDFTPEKLGDLIKKFEEKDLGLEFVAMNACPLDFNYEVIKYCRENNITVIGLNQFGGNISAQRNIQAFTVPYLLGFSAANCEIILLSGRDLIRAGENFEYLKQLYRKDLTPEYILKKSVSRPVKELKKAVYSSVKVDSAGNYVIPYTNSSALIENDFISLKIGSPIEKYSEVQDKMASIETIQDIDIEDKEESVESSVQHLLNILYYPSDACPASKFSVARYKVLEYLGLNFPDHEINLLGVGSSILWIHVSKEPTTKGHLLWTKVIPGVERQFFLVQTSDGKVIFRENHSKEENAPVEE